MEFEVYTDDLGSYDRELENSILNKIIVFGGQRKDEHCDAIIDINSIEELIKLVRLHPDKEVVIYAPSDEKPSITYCDVRDDWEKRQYGMTEEEKKEELEIFKALKDSKIFYINDEGDDYYCETDSGVSFIPEALDWAY